MTAIPLRGTGGKRVKSVIGGQTTLFVGGHYEVTGSQITKYYFAGSQRIAMRVNGTLSYLLGDHVSINSTTARLDQHHHQRQCLDRVSIYSTYQLDNRRRENLP